MLDGPAVLAAFKECGITHVVWLPDSEANFMYQVLSTDKELKLVQVCREAETMAIAFGLNIGGKQPVCLIQNTGFMEPGDSLRGLLLDLDIAMLLMIGYRGWRGGQKMTDSAGHFLEPLVDAWGIKHYLLESDAELGRIGEGWKDAQAASKPVAVLVGREYG